MKKKFKLKFCLSIEKRRIYIMSTKKQFKRSAALGTLMALSITGSAYAASADWNGDDRVDWKDDFYEFVEYGKVAAELVEKEIDLNGDGKATFDDATYFFAQADLNKDGKVSLDEIRESIENLTQNNVPDGNVPDGNVPDGNVPDGNVPDGNVPDGNVPDGNVPDGNVPDGNVPDGNVPDGNVPDGNVPDGNVPEQGGNSGSGSTPSIDLGTIKDGIETMLGWVPEGNAKNYLTKLYDAAASGDVNELTAVADEIREEVKNNPVLNGIIGGILSGLLKK